jgi:hypothetical protein
MNRDKGSPPKKSKWNARYFAFGSMFVASVVDFQSTIPRSQYKYQVTRLPQQVETFKK